MPASRMEIARAFAREEIERNPDITVAIVTGSTARNDGVETSDIDIRLLMDDNAGKPVTQAYSLGRTAYSWT